MRWRTDNVFTCIRDKVPDFIMQELLLSCGSPRGSITSGSCSGRGFQSWWFFVRRVSVFSSASHRIFTTTLPGVPEEKIRWWNDVMPSKAPLLKYGWKCSGVEGSGSGVEGSEASTSESEGSRGSYKLNSFSKRGGIDSDSETSLEPLKMYYFLYFLF